MERMKRLSEKSGSYQITQEELSKRFETVETQSAELAAAPQRSSSFLNSDIGLFIEDPTFIYEDFAKVGEIAKSNRLREVSQGPFEPTSLDPTRAISIDSRFHWYKREFALALLSPSHRR
jgi:hypothetical protein